MAPPSSFQTDGPLSEQPRNDRGNPTSLHLRTESLRRAFSALLEHVEHVAGEEIRIDRDYYWSIDQRELYDPYRSPTHLTIGQLSECQANLDRFSDDPSTVVSYGFVWLAELLRAVGSTVVR